MSQHFPFAGSQPILGYTRESSADEFDVFLVDGARAVFDGRNAGGSQTYLFAETAHRQFEMLANGLET
jgi:hypothetical protein